MIHNAPDLGCVAGVAEKMALPSIEGFRRSDTKVSYIRHGSIPLTFLNFSNFFWRFGRFGTELNTSLYHRPYAPYQHRSDGCCLMVNHLIRDCSSTLTRALP
jgi:hypothetical protein